MNILYCVVVGDVSGDVCGDVSGVSDDVRVDVGGNIVCGARDFVQTFILT